MIIKNTIKLALKSILLYTTFIICILSIIGIDDIYNKGYFLIDMIICVGLIYTCYKTINKEDILLLDKYLNEETD